MSNENQSEPIQQFFIFLNRVCIGTVVLVTLTVAGVAVSYFFVRESGIQRLIFQLTNEYADAFAFAGGIVPLVCVFEEATNDPLLEQDWEDPAVKVRLLDYLQKARLIAENLPAYDENSRQVKKELKIFFSHFSQEPI